MSQPVEKTLNTQNEDSESRNFHAKRKASDGASQSNYMAFYETFVNTTETPDNFEVIKSNLHGKKRPKGAKVARIASLINIPEVWTVSSLAKMYDTLYDIFGNKSRKSGQDIVKAIIEMTLTHKSETINLAFAPETFTTKKPANESSTIDNSTPTKFPDTKSPREQLAKFIGQKTGAATGNFKMCYLQTLFWVPYDLEGDLPHLLTKHTAQAALSWFSSYIILQAYGNHKDVRGCFKNPMFQDLTNVWKRELGNVYAQYQRFFVHPISDSLEWNKRKFIEARFLARVGDDESQKKKLFIDDLDFQNYLQSSADVEPEEIIDNLVQHVIAKTEKFTDDKDLQKFKVNDGICRFNMQAELLNLVASQSSLDNHYKQSLEQDVQGIRTMRELYVNYRTKECLPPSCSWQLFLEKVSTTMDSYFKSFSARSFANEETFEDDAVRHKKLKRMQIETEAVRIPNVPIDYKEEEKSEVKITDQHLTVKVNESFTS